jgi:glycine/D-amino acid oxidase-like deaminating enzyme
MRLRPAARAQTSSTVSVIGAGIAGAWQALVFARAGYAVTLYERSGETMMLSTSHWAGGMLAPYCEGESAEPLISRLGVESVDLWRKELPDTPFNGSLVVAHARDRGDFDRFARRTSNHRQLDLAALQSLEPSLGDRFGYGLFFPGEGHVESHVVSFRNCISVSSRQAGTSSSTPTSGATNSQASYRLQRRVSMWRRSGTAHRQRRDGIG